MVCKIEHCGRKIHAKGLCKKHYEKQRIYGTPYKRTTGDRNEIVEYKDYAEIMLYNLQNKEIARAIIDKEDIEKVKNYKWGLLSNKNKYVQTKINSKKVSLHRFLLNVQGEMVIDHINHNPLDNRKNNLRICTNQQNIFNSSVAKNNTSGHRGVIWHKGHKSWMAVIIVNGKFIYLGYYKDKKRAITVRREAEIKYFGEFAPCLSGVN